jgi:chromatin segregation and condensation protein Rec8/ScpA/Scc1 (kleisin family)
MEEVPLETTWEEVFAAALRVELPDPRAREHSITRRSTVTMEEKVQLIMSTLQDVAGVEFRKLLAPFQEKMHGVMTFLAGLELARRRRVLLRQTGPFHDLWIYFRKEDDEDAEPLKEEEEGES